MAMDGNAMGDAIKAQLDGLAADPTKQAFWRAVGRAVVDYIKANAAVSSTVAIPAGAVQGVTSGAGTGGPATGTATGTVS